MAKCLRNCKRLSLTPFQVLRIVGLSDPDSLGMVDYKDFATVCKTAIENGFYYSKLIQKQLLLAQNLIPDIQHPVTEDFDFMELMRVFQKYDRTENGVLAIGDYIKCLEECDLELKKNEIITLAAYADMDDTGKIDYQENVKHFTDVLDMIRFHEVTQKAMEEFYKRTADTFQRHKTMKDEQDKSMKKPKSLFGT